MPELNNDYVFIVTFSDHILAMVIKFEISTSILNDLVLDIKQKINVHNM